MTTLELELSLMRHFDIRRNVIVHNVTDMSFLLGFESDLVVLSKSNYCTVVELKISKADLRNDLKKKHIARLNKIVYNGKTGKDFYYSMLKYFYYAVPEFLKEEAIKQIPDFAGLLIAKEVDAYNNGSRIIRIVEVRHPIIINNYKWTIEERLKLAELGSMRIYNLKQNIKELQQYKP